MIPVLLAPVSFATHWIQGSQNRAAAAVLFTPCANSAKQHHGPVPAQQYPPPFPTPQ